MSGVAASNSTEIIKVRLKNKRASPARLSSSRMSLAAFHTNQLAGSDSSTPIRRTPSGVSPNSKVPAEWYAGNYKLKVANQILSGATAVIFDASDLMPPSVGGGSFWTQISDWANNNGSNTDAVLKNIDDSWPS